MVILTLITLLVEVTIVDPTLRIIGNALVTVVISLIGLIHGLLLFLIEDEISGILQYIEFLLK